MKPNKTVFCILLAILAAACLTLSAFAGSASSDAGTVTGSASFTAPEIGSATGSVPVLTADSPVEIKNVHWERMLDTGYSAPYTDTVIHKGNYILCATFVVPEGRPSAVRIDGKDWTVLSAAEGEGGWVITAASPAVSATGYERDNDLPADSMSTIIIIAFSVMGVCVVAAVVITILFMKKKNKNTSENGDQQ